MCVGLAILLGPPTVGGACYFLMLKGQRAVLRTSTGGLLPLSATTAGVGLGGVVGAYWMQRVLLVRHFDTGGALALDWKQGTESLGRPLEIRTWGQFYRACGPPIFARVAALMVSFYIGGMAQAYVEKQRQAPSREPQTKQQPRRTR